MQQHMAEIDVTTRGGEAWRLERLRRVAWEICHTEPSLSDVSELYEDGGVLYVNFDWPLPDIHDVLSIWRIWEDRNEGRVNIYAQGVPLLGANPIRPFKVTFSPIADIENPEIREGLSLATDDMPVSFNPAWDPPLIYRRENLLAVRNLIDKLEAEAREKGALNYKRPRERLSVLAALLEAGLPVMDNTSGGLLVANRYVVAPQKKRWRRSGTKLWTDYAGNDDLLAQLVGAIAMRARERTITPAFPARMQRTLVAAAIETAGGSRDFSLDLHDIEILMQSGYITALVPDDLAPIFGNYRFFEGYRITSVGLAWLVDAGLWCAKTNSPLIKRADVCTEAA